MDNNNNNQQQPQRSIQDEHLDFMLKLTYRHDAEEQERRFAEEFSDDAAFQDMPAREEGYRLFLKKVGAHRRQERMEICLRKVKQFSLIAGKAAAALIIAAAIITPIAIATIEPVRIKLMSLLFDIQSCYTRLNLENNALPVEIPEDWEGEYFPMYVPEGMEVSFANDDTTMYITPENEFSQKVSFWECEENTMLQIDSESADISHEPVNNCISLVAEKDGKLVLSWSNGHKYFMLSSSLSKAETLRIANSLSPINR